MKFNFTVSNLFEDNPKREFEINAGIDLLAQMQVGRSFNYDGDTYRIQDVNFSLYKSRFVMGEDVALGGTVVIILEFLGNYK